MGVTQISFSLPACALQGANVLDRSKACFRRLQNSPSVQTVVIANLNLRQALYVKIQLRKRSVAELVR